MEPVDAIAEQARIQKSRLVCLIQSREPYDDQVAAAREYIRLSYAWQTARFGRVRQRYDVRYLLRALG
jgi:hypothetical protein